MKKLYIILMVLVLGSMLAACSASTANITAADAGTGFDSSTNKVTGATTTFDKAAPEIHVVVAVANVPDGTTLRGVLTAVAATDMNGNAVKDKQVTELTNTLTSDTSLDYKFIVPSTGEWPVGTYKVDIYLNDKLDRTVNITVQ